jgi:Ca2+-binding RTX toxin-like protein
MPVVRDYTAILSGSALHDGSGKGAFYTFSFPEVVPDYYSGNYPADGLASFRPLTEEERAAVRRALDAWASVSGITFFEVPAGQGDMQFGAYDLDLMGYAGFAGFASYPGGRWDGQMNSDVFLDWSYAGNDHVLLHEIGHALGLKHTFDGGDITLASDLDDFRYSVMSYTSGGVAGDVLGEFDVQAIQFLYGDAGADGHQITSWSWDPATFTLTQTGSAAAESIFGVGASDVIQGLAGNDLIQGRGGPDRLNGGEGDDELFGGAGNDLLVGENGKDRLEAGEGDDRLEGGADDDTLYAGAGDDILIGGSGNDFLNGELGSNTYDAGDGDDSLYATYDGGPLVFTVDGGAGTDFLGISISYLLSSPALSLLDSLAGGSTIANLESISVWGNDNGNDLVGSPIKDFLTGGAGIDSLAGGGGDDYLQGLDGSDDLSGGAGADYLTGGAGDDRLEGGSQSDTLVGGPGADRFIYASASDSTSSANDYIEDFESGIDKIDVSALTPTGVSWTQGSYANTGGVYSQVTVTSAGGDLSLFVDGPVQLSDFVMTAAPGPPIVGGAGADVIQGTGGADTIRGLGGNDTLNGLGGNDLLDGGAGADLMRGGTGNDSYVVDQSGDRAEEAANGGSDEIRSSITLVLPDYVENLILTGTAAVNGTGNALPNMLTGNGAANILNGAAGADWMAGGLGNDVYLVDSGDLVVEDANAGTDEVRTALDAYTLTANVEKLTGTSPSGQRLTGNGLANVITGGAGGDVIDGGAGADRMSGGLGDDSYYIGDPGDVVVDTGGLDRVSTTLADTTAPAGVEFLTGLLNSGQTLRGNALDNSISGGTGADRMVGGAGNDQYWVSWGDNVVEAADGGTDEVYTELPSYTLTANVERLFGFGSLGQILTGNALANVIDASLGADIIDGGAGADRMVGWKGNDVYFVGDLGDVVVENPDEGTDEVRTTLSDTTAAANVERLTGLLDTGQTLRGNALGNLIAGGAGADRMVGGAGDDVYLASTGDIIVEAVDGGVDEVRTSLATYTLGSNLENLTGTSASGQVLTGNAAANVLKGGAGNDILDGGAGGDSHAGGRGDDIYYVRDLFDGVIEKEGEGDNDRVYASLSYRLGTAVHVEILSTTSDSGTDPLHLTGNEFDNRIIGNAGSNLLDGGIGNDRLEGLAGNDTYIVDSTGDAVTEAAGQGRDIILTSVSYALAATNEIEVMTLMGAQALNLTGNGFGNVLNGNSGDNRLLGGDGNDVLDGGLGADWLDGGAGNDVYYFGSGDVVVEALDAGTDEMRTSSSDTIAAANVENLTGVLNTGQTLRGNGLSNIIAGGDGADRMVGGAGNDVYLAGAGDNVIEKPGEGIDEVRTALAVYSLTADVERLTGTSAAGQKLTGNGLANLITGGAGNDRIDGGAGADQMFGWSGNDVYVVGELGDVVSEAFNSGIDEIRTSLSDTTAPANVENITGLLDTGQTLRGNGLDNVIAGGAGADRMIGGAGHDLYLVGAGDNVIESSAAGVDEVRTAVAAYTLTANVEHLTGTSAAEQALTGNALANVIIGGSGADRLTGGGGADVFRYQAVTESYSAARDHILDFTPGTDKIDLAWIDASRALAGDQAFTWIGSNAFSNVAGQLRAFQSGAQWIVEGDVNGDGYADLVIALTLQGPAPLGAGDFLL